MNHYEKRTLHVLSRRQIYFLALRLETILFT